MTATEILSAISSTEECSFNEFLRGLPEVPSDASQWKDLMVELDTLADMDLVHLDRGFNNKITALQLTELGTERVRESRRQ